MGPGMSENTRMNKNKKPTLSLLDLLRYDRTLIKKRKNVRELMF